MVIRSKRLRPAPAPKPPTIDGVVPVAGPRIIIRPDGKWGFPEQDNQISPEDEEVLKKTTQGIPDINYIQHEDC